MPAPARWAPAARPPPEPPRACSRQALGRLFAVAEAYPQLRATENFQQLQNELTNTEDQISAARRIYNGNVQSYNSSIQVFPNSLHRRHGRLHAAASSSRSRMPGIASRSGSTSRLRRPWRLPSGAGRYRASNHTRASG